MATQQKVEFKSVEADDPDEPWHGYVLAGDNNRENHVKRIIIEDSGENNLLIFLNTQADNKDRIVARAVGLLEGKNIANQVSEGTPPTYAVIKITIPEGEGASIIGAVADALASDVDKEHGDTHFALIHTDTAREIKKLEAKRLLGEEPGGPSSGNSGQSR
ncbi:MAG: hypothetical protein KGI29_03665 [Pseudomonadota bacterium]|nr:hypothetical protein [Pseudomonadota bacterium]MDE3037650.1 hypothetical protein [Pseudomonadota bacterium]